MLLKTIAELKSYVALDTKGILPSFELELKEAEAYFILPLLGAPLAKWLQEQYNATGFNPGDGSLAAQLLAAVQAPLARLATTDAITVHQVSLDETGVHIVSNDKVKTAFQWQSNQLRDHYRRRGFRGLDALVQWLENHHDDSPELQAWASSKAGQRHRQELFTCTADFQECENISESRLVFERLKPVRRRVQAFELRTTLGDDFLDELLEQVRTRTLTSDNEMLLTSRVYPALASLTVGAAIPQMALSLTGDGIDLDVARLDDSNSKEADAGLDSLLYQRGFESKRVGERYLRQLRDFLDRAASSTRFATYFNSPAYTDPKAPVVEINTVDSKVYKFC